MSTSVSGLYGGQYESAAEGAFFSHCGVFLALGMANLGAAYGTAKAGIGIATMGVLKPDLIMKSIVPIVMAGILGIYGLIIAVILIQKIGEYNDASYNAKTGYQHLASGACCGFSALAAGFAIGVVGDAGVRANAVEGKMFVGMILILIFAEALGLYGLIIAIILSA